MHFYDCGTGNTSNLKSHLRVNHTTEYVAVQNAELAEKKVRQFASSSTSCSTQSTDGPKTLKQTKLKQSSLQTSYTKFDRDHPKQILITEKIAKMIAGTSSRIVLWMIVDSLTF